MHNNIPWMGVVGASESRNIACSASETYWTVAARERWANYSMAASAVAAAHSRCGLACGPCQHHTEAYAAFGPRDPKEAQQSCNAIARDWD